MKPNLSIIIPTHNRKAVLYRTLQSLEKQTFSLEQFEVIVVADGCTDGTVEMLKSIQTSLHLEVLSTEGEGPALARNTGAAKATGPILIFLDDDIEVTEQFVSAHHQSHLANNNRVVIGNLLPVIHSRKGYFHFQLKEWWENMFLLMEPIGYRFSYRNLTSGNFSVTQHLFSKVNGFNTDFKCQEDYELGVRLINEGAVFVFSQTALGYHHELTDLPRALKRKFDEGKAAVLFAKRYPQLIPTLPLLKDFRTDYTLYQKCLFWLLYKYPRAADAYANCMKKILSLLENLRMKKLWLRGLDRLLVYWYLKGLAVSTKNLSSLTSLVRSYVSNPDSVESCLEVELANGIDIAEKLVEKVQPDCLVVKQSGNIVGIIPPKSGYQRLRGVHLRPMLAKELSKPLAKTLGFTQD